MVCAKVTNLAIGQVARVAQSLSAFHEPPLATCGTYERVHVVLYVRCNSDSCSCSSTPNPKTSGLVRHFQRMRARLRHPHLHPPPPRGKNPEPNDNRRSESIRIISIRKAKGKLRVKDLSGFKTLRSVLEDVCSVLLESIASAEEFDMQNEVNVKEPRTQWDNERTKSAAKHEAECNPEERKDRSRDG